MGSRRSAWRQANKKVLQQVVLWDLSAPPHGHAVSARWNIACLGWANHGLVPVWGKLEFGCASPELSGPVVQSTQIPQTNGIWSSLKVLVLTSCGPQILSSLLLQHIRSIVMGVCVALRFWSMLRRPLISSSQFVFCSNQFLPISYGTQPPCGMGRRLAEKQSSSIDSNCQVIVFLLVVVSMWEVLLFGCSNPAEPSTPLYSESRSDIFSQ